MNYQETLDYLFSALPMFHRIGPAAYKPNLDNTHALCTILGNPEVGLVCIHIAGTNGKGSTSHMLASILQEAGYKTGLYTSPHLKDFRERIKVNGEMVSKEWVSNFVSQYKNDFENIQPSFFEMSTGMALAYFKEMKTDIAVIETGLGGRLDSTNVVTPLVSVITNIGYDHMNLLGNTLELIAKEKAGIIKESVPVVIGEYLKETQSIFTEKAIASGSEIYFTQDHYSCRAVNYNPVEEIMAVEVKVDQEIIYQKLQLDLTGTYQLKNCCTVLQTIDILRLEGLNISDSAIKSGFKQVSLRTGLQGRWQIINRNPLTICDTGHNEDGLKETLPMITALPHDQLRIVLGMVDDKDLNKILYLFPKEAKYYFCKADIPRGMDATLLSEKATSLGLTGSIYESVRSALDAAQKDSEMNDVIFVGGSTFTVAEVL